MKWDEMGKYFRWKIEMETIVVYCGSVMESFRLAFRLNVQWSCDLWYDVNVH